MIRRKLSQLQERLADRLEDTVREFPVCLVLGGASEHVLRHLAKSRTRVQRVILADTSQVTCTARHPARRGST